MNTRLRAALPALVCLALLSGCNWFVSVDERISRAQAHLAKGEDRAAAIELQNALSSQPDNVEARLLMARVSLRQGDVEGAKNELSHARDAGAPAAELAELAADVRLAQGEYAPLLADIDAGKTGLDAAHAATYRGLALLATHDLAGASDAFRAALAADAGLTRAHVGLAESLAQSGDFDGALREIAGIVDKHPEETHAWVLEGRILAQRGDFQEARQALLNARKNAGASLTTVEYSTLLATLVETSLASGDPAAAKATLKELADRMPNAPLVSLLSARIAMAEQRYPVAVTEAQKVVAAAPNHPMAKLVLGAALLANGNYNQAEVQLSQLVAQSPDNLEARKLLADTNLRLQRPEMAVEVLTSAQQAGGTDAQVESLLAWANLQRGDEDAAIDLIKRSLAAHPESDKLKLDLALAYVTAGRNQDAVDLLDSMPARADGHRREQLLIAAIGGSRTPEAARAEVEKIVKANANDVGVLTVAANFHARNRDFPRARELLNAARAADPGDTGSLSSLARLESAAGDERAARAALQELLKLDPANRQARLSLAQMALRANDVAAGIEQLEAVRKAEPQAADARLVLASIYLRQRKSKEADEVLGELGSLGRQNAAVAVATGRLYASVGRYDEALGLFRSAAQRDPKNAAWLLDVARVQQARGDRLAARVTLDQALALEPDSIAANAQMATLEQSEGRKEQALARAQSVRKRHPQSAGAAMLEGDVQLALRNAPAAAKAFADAYALTPSSAAAIRVYQARSITRANDATASLENWLRREPGDVTARLVYAQGLLERGRHAEAIAQYELAQQAGPPGVLALNNLAWLYQQVKDPRAQATARKAFDLAPDNAAVADTYGWILVESGRAAEALPILERASRAAGAGPEVRFHHAAALARAGRSEEARTALRQLLAEPQFPMAAQARELLAGLDRKP